MKDIGKEDVHGIIKNYRAMLSYVKLYLPLKNVVEASFLFYMYGSYNKKRYFRLSEVTRNFFATDFKFSNNMFIKLYSEGFIELVENTGTACKQCYTLTDEVNRLLEDVIKWGSVKGKIMDENNMRFPEYFRKKLVSRNNQKRVFRSINTLNKKVIEERNS